MATARAPARARPATRRTPRPRPFPTARRSTAVRSGIAYLDPLLAFAAIGLISFSIFTLAVTTK